MDKIKRNTQVFALHKMIMNGMLAGFWKNKIHWLFLVFAAQYAATRASVQQLWNSTWGVTPANVPTGAGSATVASNRDTSWKTTNESTQERSRTGVMIVASDADSREPWSTTRLHIPEKN